MRARIGVIGVYRASRVQLWVVVLLLAVSSAASLLGAGGDLDTE
jgi:hypothetical protein